MDADNTSIPETPKTETSASSVQTPATIPESAISATPEGAGSRKEDNEEKRWNVVVRTVPYARTYGLLIPLRVIPEHQRRDDVIEAKVSRVSDPRIEYPLYTTHKPGYKRAYLDLFLIEPKPKEEFCIGTVRRYPESEFATGYNAVVPRGLENTRLVWRDGFRMKVEEAEVELAKSKLRTYQGQAVLEAELGNAGAIKIAKSLETFFVRLRDHSPVTSITARSGRIEMTYSRTGHDAYAHRRQVGGSGTPEPKPAPAQTSKLSFATKQHWRETRDVYVIEASGPTIRLVQAMLASARNLDEFREVKGDIGEEMVRQVLPAIGMELIADHPWNVQRWLTGSKRLGPDLLVRAGRPQKRLYYIEVKWWGEIDSAYTKAERQVIEDCKKYPSFHGEKIAGGYVAVVSWKAEDKVILLQVTRARKKDELK